ncbi:MAG: hypothetical protein ACYSW6_11705 [Planctomycetota bacterium]
MQDKPTSGMEGNVMAIGVSKVKAGGAFGRGQRLKVNSAATTNTGTVIASTCEIVGGQANVGYALEAASAAGEIIAAVINFKG